MIKAIIFDFGQTLVDSADGFRAAEKIAKETIAKDIFYKPDNTQREKFVNEYRLIRKKFHKKSNFSRPVIWKAVYDMFNSKSDTQKLVQLETEYWETVKSLTTPFPETVSVLADLANHFQLGVITNTQGQKNSQNHRIELFSELEQYFETIIIAGESGLPPKPDPKPFSVCLGKMNLKPCEAVYVGDDFDKDIRGASKAGLHPVWLKHYSVNRTWPQPSTCLNVNIIDTLEELLELICIEEVI